MKSMVALYKAYRGGEWFKASLESIHKECVGAVVAMASRPWDDRLEQLPNNCGQPIEEFFAEHPGFRVIACPFDAPKHEIQYNFGLSRVVAEFGPNVSVLVIDTDEIWEPSDLATLRRAISDNPSKRYFTSGIFDHVKSPLYRVDPQPVNRPLVGLQTARGEVCRSGRFSRLDASSKAATMDVPVNYYHYPYVRVDWNEVNHKLLNTGYQDGAVRHNWFAEFWTRLPWGQDLHPDSRCGDFWKGVKVVGIDELPSALRASPNLPRLIGCGHGSGLSLQPLLPRFERPFADPHYAIDGLVDMCLRVGCRERHAVEIGSYAGESAEVLAQYVDHLTCVDPWGDWRSPSAAIPKASEVEGLFDARTSGISNIYKRKGYSADAAKTFCDRSLGLVYIDGDHTYESVAADIRAWLPKIAPEGWIAGHDFRWHPGVFRAVCELLGPGVETFKDTSWAFQVS